MSRTGGVRRPRCHNVVAVHPAWALRDICPHCLQPLSTTARGKDPPAGPSLEREPGEAVVLGWMDAFNARDLDGMLSRMSVDVDFHPLRFDGLARDYQGHDGVRQWFGDLVVMRHEHRIELAEVRPGSDDQIVALGEVRIAEGSDSAPFWSLTRVIGGLIVTAYHYLTDPDVMDTIRPRNL